jgi:chromosome segregation ATPase
MSQLENTVNQLASALDALETRLDERLAELGAHSDAIDAARRQARTARTHAGEASEGIAEAIGELRRLLAETEDAVREKD